MPEIKNNEVKPQSKSGQAFAPKTITPESKPEKLFELPQRRSRLLPLLSMIAIVVIILVGGYFLYGFFNRAKAPIQSPVVEQPKEEVKVAEGTAYYLTYDNDSQEPRIYQYTSDSAQPDKKISDFNQKIISVLGKYLGPYTYAVSVSGDGNAEILDAKTGQLSPLFDLPNNGEIRSVALSSDKQWLAYGRNYEATDKTKSGGEVYLYNTETKEQKQLIKRTELGLYQGYSVLGWRDNDKEIVINDIGCDGGGCGGDIYDVNVSTGVATKIAPIDTKDFTNTNNFLRGSLSPDGSEWLFAFCATPDDATRAKEEAGTADACISGAELRTYDFATKKISTVYQNLRYDNNSDKNILRTFMSFVWQDNNTIIAAVPGALLSIPLNSNDKPKEILTYDGTMPQKFGDDFVSLISATKDSVVFSRDNGAQVLDLTSGKITNINTDGRNESFTFWLN